MATADPMRLIVNRKPNSIAIYLAMPLPEFKQRFGGLPEQMQAGPSGLDIDPLREGTVESVDWLIARSQAHLGGEPATLEPLSAMVHPTALALPFSTPRDGTTAVSVCTAPTTEPLPLSEFTFYGGLFLYPVDGRKALDLRLGKDADGEAMVSEYWDWQPVGASQIYHMTDEGLSLPALNADRMGLWAAAAAAFLALAWHAIRRRQRGSARP